MQTKLDDEGIRNILSGGVKFEGHDWIIIDEIQFFDKDLVFNFCYRLLSLGFNVCCAGLNQDSFGKPFGGIGNLMAIADNVVLLKARCNICNNDATKTQRLVSSSSEQILVGGEDLYQPRCLEHWLPSVENNKHM